MRYMCDWRDSIILELERQCTATQRGHHWGMGVHRLLEHTPHVHYHRDGGHCSQLCAGCQSSTGGGESRQLGMRKSELN